MRLEDAMIARSGYGAMKDATIEVRTTEESMNRVLNAEEPMAAYIFEEQSGQMMIEGKNFGSDLKIKVAMGMGSIINSFVGSLR